MKIIVRPERIVKSKIPEFLRLVWIEQTSGCANHVYAQSAIQVLLSLIVRSYPYPYFNTH